MLGPTASEGRAGMAPSVPSAALQLQARAHPPQPQLPKTGGQALGSSLEQPQTHLGHLLRQPVPANEPHLST